MREMKDSGVEWIGEIPVNWSIERLQWHLYEIKESNNPIKTTQILSLTNKYGVIPYEEKGEQGNKAKENYNEYKLAYPDTIVANSMNILIGSVGICHYYGCVSPVYYVFKPHINENLNFLNYVFQMEQFQKELRRFANGILEIRLRLSAANILKRVVAFPPCEEQIIISRFLDKKCSQIDALISNAQQQIEKLKAYKQSIITETVTKGLDPDAPMKDSGVEYLGKIPSNWGIISIGIAFKYMGGYAFKSELFCGETENQVLRIGNIKNDNLILNEKQVFIRDDYAEQARNCEVDEEDILFTMTGTKGKKDYFYTLLVSADNLRDKNLFINQRVGIFRKKVADIIMRYYNYVLKEYSILNYIFLSETGTANQGNLGIENISRTKMFLPPLDEQLQIADYLDTKCSQIDNLISIKQKKIDKLQQYKKSLIYEYVTGKKEV